MKTANDTFASHGITRREGLLTLLGGAMALAGCGGGGGGVATVGGGGTGSFSVGPITGFGSIIVNGIRFDDSAASILDDDGADMRGKLKLGMLATVKGSPVSGTSATATSVVVGSELKGRIEGTLNSVQKTFVVLGQTVQVTGSTVFDESLPKGFGSLATDTIVEVHGILDPAANTLQATFIEKENAPALFRIQGLASQHDATAKRFNIGSIRIDYSNATDVRIVPNNGALVRVRLTAVLPPAAIPPVWFATRIRPPEEALEDRDEAEVEGAITAFTSTSQFSVNGLAVDASGASFPDGTAGIVLGARVEVKGSLSNGVLVATRVKIEDRNEVDNLEFELHGTVSGLTATSFTLTSLDKTVAVKVNFSGSVPGLVNTAQVEVRGTVADSSASSISINATRISFES
ncbi:MAG: DUF5666 domain-containing protein [Polaromonas sp.]